MSDPVEVLLNSPRSVKAMQNLGLRKEDLNALSREELKAKLGNMKISKHELESKWNEHETQRKDRIQQVLEVGTFVLSRGKLSAVCLSQNHSHTSKNSVHINLRRNEYSLVLEYKFRAHDMKSNLS